MKKSRFMGIYPGEVHTAIGLNLTDSGSMYFLLPTEGTDVNSLFEKDEFIELFADSESWQYTLVNLSVPKFKVSSKVDLIDTLSKLGVKDVLDSTKSDFTPLTREKDNLYLSKAEHAAMVEIDEKGVSGAAYTELAITEGAAMVEDEVDFVHDRPFLFMVTAADGSILFSGAVRNID